MSDKCGNCNCADSSQCVKKGNQYGVELFETKFDNLAPVYSEFMMMEGAENGCKCKCGGSCSCTVCKCGSH